MSENNEGFIFEPKDSYSPFINYRTPLTNTYNKLKNNKELTVIYFGGSVTVGYGSDDKDNRSWRALSGKWLRKNFPDSDIKTINTAIGESGTYLGTYRVECDVIANKPDLLFIEYAINDNYKGASKEQAALQYETIVREVRTALPECDIVTLLVTDISRCECLPSLFPTAAGHKAIADVYGIPTVNVGAALVSSLNDKNEEWNNFYIDFVHPNDAGYLKYFECLEEFLHNSLLTDSHPSEISPHSMPSIQSEHLLDGDRKSLMGKEMCPHLVSANGFYYSEELYFGIGDTPHYGYYYADSSNPHAEINFSFTGTELAIWTNFYGMSTIELSIDSGEPSTINCDNHAPTLLCSRVASGRHTVTIRPKTYEERTGGQMRIGALFVRDETKQTNQYYTL